MQDHGIMNRRTHFYYCTAPTAESPQSSAPSIAFPYDIDFSYTTLNTHNYTCAYLCMHARVSACACVGADITSLRARVVFLCAHNSRHGRLLSNNNVRNVCVRLCKRRLGARDRGRLSRHLAHYIYKYCGHTSGYMVSGCFLCALETKNGVQPHIYNHRCMRLNSEPGSTVRRVMSCMCMWYDSSTLYRTICATTATAAMAAYRLEILQVHQV